MADELPTTPRVCVLLPVHRDAQTLRNAFASMQAQTLRDWRCLLLVNGPDRATFELVRELASGEPRAELMVLDEASLPKALNTGLRRAADLGVELCARMDADDWSMPHRLDVQVGALRQSDAAAIGCDWEVWDSDMHALQRVVQIPTDAREARWRLLMENPFAHGSMLLRTRSMLEIGGYDETMTRAQDYDLWLRLCGRRAAITSVPQVLYRHRSKDAARSAGVLEQARFAARAKLRAWARLPFDDGQELAEVLARVQAGELGREAGRRCVEGLLREHGPTREAMMAWMQLRAEGEAGASAETADDIFVRRLATEARHLASGTDRPVYLFPGGRVARRALLEQGLENVVTGVVDDEIDNVRTALAGLQVSTCLPQDLPSHAIVLLASHAHAAKLWQASGAMRERGVEVRLVGQPADRTPTR